MGLWDDFKAKVQGVIQPAMAPIQKAVPSLTTSEGAQSTFGTAAEPMGMASGGGRRLSKKGKKTRKSHKKVRKTRKH